MRMVQLRTPILLLTLALAACVDASAADERADPSLCSEERDAHWQFCNPDEERIDSTEALALLEQRFPAAEIYVTSSRSTLNVDGRDTRWNYVLRSEAGAWLSVDVYASAEIEAGEVDADCAGEPFEPLDSRRAVHEAIARLEERAVAVTHQAGELSLDQNTCGSDLRPEAHYVQFLIRPSTDAGEPGDYYFARFRHDGSFIDLIGPCADRDLSNCLDGIVVEPGE
jgi:hypothetical protein